MTVDSTVQDIKSLKIQGASNVAKAALKAYAHSKNRGAAAKKLIAARPTEPMLKNLLKLAAHQSPEQILGKLASDADKITMFGARLLAGLAKSVQSSPPTPPLANKKRQGQGVTNSWSERQRALKQRPRKAISIYTHCHSSTCMKIIKAAEPAVVYATETRPLYQGRITARELASAGIKVEHSIDSLMATQIEKCDVVLLGADAITTDGFYNKVGSLAVCLLASARGKPVYVCSHSLKFSEKGIEIEQREPSEVWNKPPRAVTILNPAFEFVPKEFVAGVICEKGVVGFSKL